MSVSEIKKKFRRIIDKHKDTTPYELRRIFNAALREWEMEKGFDVSNKNKTWTDDELRVILSDAPTMENCMKHARAFKRGYGSIEQTHRWASSSREEIKRKRPDDAFVKQIKRIAKEVGWRGT